MRDIVNEGLRPDDLKDMVHALFEVDTFKSKMGEDRDVCVVSFKVRDRDPAKDLMEFIEKGYTFVLDADVSSGENNQGEYNVFVEIARSHRLADQIKELAYGVHKLTGIDDFQFKYHQKGEVHEANFDNLKKLIPATPGDYDGLMHRVQTENIKNFFSKTLMDDLTLDGDNITIHKPFNQSIKLKLVSDDSQDTMLESITDKITVDEKSTAETFWLTKVLGDYNIHKYGDYFMFENGQRAMLLQRIEQ
jgi:hypothetical protein